MCTVSVVCSSFVLSAAVALAGAQEGSTSPRPSEQKKTVTVQVQSGSAVGHLKQARGALGRVSGTNLSAHAGSRLSELRTRFDMLERSYTPGGTKTISQQEGTYGNKVKISQSPDWSSRVGEIDRLVGELLGFPTAGGQRIQVDDTTRARLEEFRKHLTEFAKAANGTIGPPARR